MADVHPAPTSAPALRLRLFGSASLERDGAPVVGRAAQRHRLALLALLACSPGASLGRERLIALLWPESDRERGRNLLKVSVYELRKALGEDALVTAGDDLRIDPRVVAVDVLELEAAVARGDAGAVVALHRGPLLDGFHVDDAPELERWLDGQRARYAAHYATALERLATEAAASGDRGAAVAWWRRRAAHDPYDSRVALALMHALEASGNRAGAIQHASVHERLLRQELGMPPAPEVLHLAARLRSAPVAAPVPGGAADAPPRPAPPEAPPPPAAPAPPAPSDAPPLPAGGPVAAPRAAGAHRRRRSATLPVLAAAIVALLAVALLVRARWPGGAPPERSVAVLPFVNMSPDGGAEYFSDGVTEEIITQLSAYPTLKVISRTSAMRYKRSAKSLRQIADELGVEHVLEGSVRREGGRVRITAQLVDARTDAHRWARSYDRELVDALGVQAEIAREVAAALEVELRGARGAASGPGTRDAEAYQLYLQGRYHWHTRTPDGHGRAIALFQRAIARDSSYADAYAGLADAYLTAYLLNVFDFRAREAEAFSRMRWAAERAVALNDRSAAAHSSLAMLRLWQRDWPAAEREFLRALELGPGDALARTWYAQLLAISGRTEGALRESRRAWELDPYALVAGSNYAANLAQARRYDEAVAQYRRTIELGPAWVLARRGLGVVLALQGAYAEALQAVRRAVQLEPQLPEMRADLAYVLALDGQRAAARAILDTLRSLPEDARLAAAAYSIGRAHMALGEADSAFAWLERADWRWPPRANLYSPTLDPLRSDPRFARLEARVLREMRVR